MLFPLLGALAGERAAAAPASNTGGVTVPQSSPSTLKDASYMSRALGGRVNYAVYLPPGYATSGTRYPVIYFLHGLPAGPNAYRSIGWLAGALEQTGRKAILIGAQGSRAGDADPEWIDLGPGRNWETATASELVSVVDRRYRTIRRRTAREILGVSAGGYGAAAIGFHHPGTFSVIQAWSGYFRPTNPAGSAILNLGSKASNDRANLHALVPSLHTLLGSNYGKTYVEFYVGTREPRFRSDDERLARELQGSGFPHLTFALYPGTHSAGLWEAHARPWLSTGLRQLAPPS